MTTLSRSTRPVKPRRFGEGLIDPDPEPAPSGEWRTEIDTLLRSLGYHMVGRAEVLEQLKATGRAARCESLDAEDYAIVDAIYTRHAPLAVDEHTPRVKPFEPSAEDVRWWFQRCDAADRLRLNPNGVRKPFRHWKGERSSNGHFTDRDAARSGAVG